MNVQPDKPPSQIDYVLVSTRWSSSVRASKTSWGISIDVHGRKYDHALVQIMFKTRLKCSRKASRKDFTALKQPEIAVAHQDQLQNSLESTPLPTTATEQWKRLSSALHSAQSTLPKVSLKQTRKWETSVNTTKLIERRKRTWENMSKTEQADLKREISRSVRNDYKEYIRNIVEDMEKADTVGNYSEVFKLSKRVSSRKGNAFTQPSKDHLGNTITSTEQQLESWALFLENKFSASPGEPTIDLQDVPNQQEEIVPNIDIEEVKTCVKMLKTSRAPGPDEVPIEQYKNNDIACTELHQLISMMWSEEYIPEDFVLGEMLMFYKKKCKDNRGNYRAIGLLNHSYKVFAMVLLQRIIPYIDPKLSQMQAGFGKSRGCRDNVLILVLAINKLLEKAENRLRSLAIITYIDFVAAFDSVYHSYLLESLKKFGVPLKYCRIIRAIYQSAAVKVRIQEVGGNRNYSRCIPIRRGVLQGDIPSPEYFIVALDILLEEFGGIDIGVQLTPTIDLSDLEYADDAALFNKDVTAASNRITHLDSVAQQTAGMSISIPKTKVQHIRPTPRVSETTEADIANLPPEKAFKFECTDCGMTYPTKHGLSVHKGRWCKKRKNAKKPSRKGTVADRVISKMKIEQHQSTLEKVMIGNNELQNVYSFVYLGAAIAGDGDHETPLKHRSDVAWGRFNNMRTTLTSTKLSIKLRVRLFAAAIVPTLIYGCEAWFFTKKIVRKLNGYNSKMLSIITKKTIHEEAREPTYDTVDQVYHRRWNYLGHVLRQDEIHAVRRYLLELSPTESPFIPGSLFADTNFRYVENMIQVAMDRNLWKKLYQERR